MATPDKYLGEKLTGSVNQRYSGGYVSVIRNSDPATKVAIRPNDSEIGRVAPTIQPRKEIAIPKVQAINFSINSHAPVELSLAGLFVRPWSTMWKWVLLFGLVTGAGVYVLSHLMPSSYSYVAYAVIMALTVPAAVVCLFAEWDITRNASFLTLALVASVGGGLAATLAGWANDHFAFVLENAGFAAVTEEPIKGLMLVALLFMVKRFPSVLSGLAIGCAIGAGFAVCENIDYAYALSSDESPSVKILAFRSFLSPMMHMAWTAALGGALWKARGVDGNWIKVVFSWTSWLVFGGMIFCHAMWNTVGAVYILVFGLWCLILHYVRFGISQAYTMNLVCKEVHQ